MREVTALAPAKINWTFEVLGQRDDGYHEVRTVMQTVSLCDRVTLREADETRLEIRGHVGGLAGARAEENLAYQANEVLARRLGVEQFVEIVIEKEVPIAGGLGGGSSNAAAVLRGLPALWDVPVEREVLRSVAAELGSDVPFFVECGTVMAAGRGEELTILADAPRKHLVLLLQEADGAKTAEMYAALSEEDFGDGAPSLALALIFNHRLEYGDSNVCNAFGRVAEARYGDRSEAKRMLEEVSKLPSHLAGAGPSRFVLAHDGEHAEWVAAALRQEGLRAVACRTLASVEALKLEVNDW